MALDWLPSYPAALSTPGGLSAASQTPFVANLVPIPTDPPPTDLIWLPHYPDWLRRARRVLSPPSSFRWPMVPIANTEWKASYPDRVRRRVLPTADIPAWFGILGVQQVIAQRMFWQARYPSILRRTKSVPPSQSVYPIQGSTIITAATCVEWAEVSLIRPTMEEDVVRRSLFAGEVVTRSILAEEGVC